MFVGPKQIPSLRLLIQEMERLLNKELDLVEYYFSRRRSKKE
ncbi:hypothetical protein [Halalkalibacterium ligniniphilum]|nr:hypothetical protein [Halalkalibacterium ligniniphilum]